MALFNNIGTLTLNKILIAAMIVFFIIGVAFTVLIIPQLKKTSRIVFITVTVMSFAAAVMSPAIMITNKINYHTAQAHGLQGKQNITVKALNDGIKNSPEEDKVPENLNGCIIIMYKFGCKDCEAIYNDLSAAVNNKDKVYWISTESPQGKELIAQYPVEEVPSGIYIRQDSFDGNIPFTSKQLYTLDENGKTVLDHAAVERLLFLQQEGR